jgi:ABC-type transport system substrate-binding protein
MYEKIYPKIILFGGEEMKNRTKWSFTLVAVVALGALILAACAQPTPEVQTIIETVVVTQEVEVAGEIVIQTQIVEVETVVEVTPEAMEPVGAEGECCDTYRIALFEDPRGLNYWSYLGPDSSVWTQYVLSGQQAALYNLSDQRFDFIPELAKDIYEPTQEGDLWVIEVEMIEGAMWSDGEPITADDVVFTQNTCKDLKLTQNWPNQCAPLGADVTAEAVDEYTVRFTFDVVPSLGVWNAGIALAPILPEHFWGETVAEARAFLEGVTEPEAARPDDCDADAPADQAACDAWVVYDEAFSNARITLYEADPEVVPSAGGYITDKLEPQAFASRSANDTYFFADARIVEYDDGTWIQELADGTTRQLYGDATGDVTLDFVGGPYAPNVVFSIYGSQDAAFLALADGEVDYVMNPLGLSRGLKEQAERGEGIETYVNADYGMFYLAFNMRKYPYSEYEFRQAVDIVLDKEFVVNSVLGGVVFPMYSTMPPGNAFWYKDVETPYIGLSREERVNQAVQVLKDAGWSWTQDPAWSEDIEDVVPGEGILMPDGNPMPETTILGPGPAYDPLRATFNQWISEWMRELGMPVESELTGFNTILDPVFVDADFDLYILGWSLGNVAFPDYYESFWHSRNDTAVTGNYNTPGLNNAEYDAAVDEFMQTTDLERARELVYEMQDILADQRPYLPLFYKQVNDLARNNIIFPYTQNLGGLESQAGFQTDSQPLSK